MRSGIKGMADPTGPPLAPLQALLGVLGGAFAIPGAATEHFIAEPVSQAIGGKAGAFAGGVAEQLPYLGLGALGKGAGQAGRVTGKIPPTYRKAGDAKIPRAMPGKATYTDKTGFGAETMERRGPGRMSDAEWAQHRREALPPTKPAPTQSFRDPISHRQTEMDPGFFGPLIENYFKSLTREGIGPSISGGAPVRPKGWDRSKYNPFQREDLESIRNRQLMGRDLTANPSITMNTELMADEPLLAALRPPMHQDVVQGYLQAGGMLPNEARKLPARPNAPPAPMVSELTRPWVGVKPAIGPQGGPLNVPKSYKKPKTYDLSEYE